MSRTCIKVLAVSALGAFAASAFGQGHFVEVKGVREFTGQLIVKPLTATQFQAKGFSVAEAKTRSLDAYLRIERLVREEISSTGMYVVTIPSTTNEDGMSANLMGSGLYEFATPNWRVFPTAKPNDPLYANQWHHQTIKSELGWNIHKGTAAATVAICDTGVLHTHEDLKSLLIKGYNAVDKKREVDGGDTEDLNGHGTHCAGDAAAQGNNSKGVAGVGWGLKIMPVRVSNSSGGGAAFSDILGGASWAAENGAKVSSCSYSGVDDPSIEAAGAYIRSKGGQLVYAAGNDNRNLNVYTFPNVIVVGASNPADGKADFSAYGKLVDVFAPGVNILSTTKDGGYGGASGTSMATPVTAGLFALIRSYNPTLTPAAVENCIKIGCDQIGSSAVFGSGRINVYKALLAAQASTAPPVTLAPASVAINYGTLAGGTIASLAAVDASFYAINSQTVTGVGQIAAITGTFTIANPSKVITFHPTVHAFTTSSQTSTGAFFLWNYTTSKFDLVGSLPVPQYLQQQTIQIGEATAPKYFNAAGQAKFMYRALSQDTRAGGTAVKFKLTFDRMALLVGSRP